MTHLFTPYPAAPLRSQLLTHPPTAVPPIEDLLSLQEELKMLKNKSLARSKKAENDLKTLDGLYKKKNKEKEKEKEKDKGKAKDKVKIKREVTDTPDPHIPIAPSSTPSSVAPGGHGVKALLSSKATTPKTIPSKVAAGMKKFSPVASGSGSSSKDKVKKEKERSMPLEKEKKKDLKKKKRKREIDESDVEEQPERHKKPKRSPEAPSHPKQKSPSKINHSVTGLHTPHATPVASFALPRHVQHIPQHPTPAPIPVPGPSHPREVSDDFSKLKPPVQTAISQFWSYVEPWLRPLREEDVGLLEWDGDEETPFVMPPLGRHYTEVWEDEDNGVYSSGAGPSTTKPTPTTATLPKWDPSTLQEADLTSHDNGHTLGPVHERLLSAMLPVPLLADGRPAAMGGAKPSVGGESKMLNPSVVDERISKLKPFEGEKVPPKANVHDMQERLVKELRSIGLLGDDEPNYSKCAEDPLAEELRQCQKRLRAQIVVNRARRRRLCDIAKSRLARNEFEEHEGALERSILEKYNLFQRRDMPKQAKKKKKSGGAGGGAHVVPDGPFAPPPHIHPAAWGMERDEEGVLGVEEELDGMIGTRQLFIDLVQPCLDGKQKERLGTMYGTPGESVFKGIEASDMKGKGR